jgi:hypothetical protein
MVRRTVIVSVVLALLLCWSACAQEPEGATIIFGRNDILVYQGTGEDRAAEPTDQPVSVGNFVINQVAPASESSLGDFGLTMRYRGGPGETMMNAQTWARPESRAGLALLCAAKDLEAPLGFRLRAWVADRSQKQAFLVLDIGRDAWHRDAAAPANRRYGRGVHRWYVETDMPSLYGGDPREPFAVVLGVGGWGAYGVQKLEIMPYHSTIQVAAEGGAEPVG